MLFLSSILHTQLSMELDNTAAAKGDKGDAFYDAKTPPSEAPAMPKPPPTETTPVSSVLDSPVASCAGGASDGGGPRVCHGPPLREFRPRRGP